MALATNRSSSLIVPGQDFIELPEDVRQVSTFWFGQNAVFFF